MVFYIRNRRERTSIKLLVTVLITKVTKSFIINFNIFFCLIFCYNYMLSYGVEYNLTIRNYGKYHEIHSYSWISARIRNMVEMLVWSDKDKCSWYGTFKELELNSIVINGPWKKIQFFGTSTLTPIKRQDNNFLKPI